MLLQRVRPHPLPHKELSGLAARLDAIADEASHAKKEALKDAGRSKLDTTRIRDRRGTERELMRREEVAAKPRPTDEAERGVPGDDEYVHISD